MRPPLVTVAIVPRERFSYAKTSLDNILATTTGDYDLLYVDGNSPPDVRDYIACQSEAHGFRVLRRETYLSPNQARNLAVLRVRTKYVVFIDNDALVSPGWLDALIGCAEETGAWVVGPIYCEGLPAATRVHMAGGRARIVERGGRRVLEEDHCHFGRPLSEVRPQLKRGPTEQIEFHCALVRRDVFDRLGPLDERLWSAAEHTDLCLTVREAGGTVYVEPASVVTYVAPPPFTKADLDYYMLRWSHAWNTATIDHFRAKWKLADDDPALAFLAGWLERHRRIAWHRASRAARALGGTPARWLHKHLIDPLERAINCRRHPNVMSYRACAGATVGRPMKTVGEGRPALPSYAQTNLQLYNQLIGAGRPEEDLRAVRDAYDLVLRLFAGQYRASGKPFVSHLVGVASILAAHDCPIETVVAGMLHSVYSHGEFGDGTRGISPRKRQRVGQAAERTVESVVAEYCASHWNMALLADLEKRKARLTPVEATVLRIKVADAIENRLDGAAAVAPFRELAANRGNPISTEALARTAAAAGCADLAATLRAFATADQLRVPACLVSFKTESFVIPPLSHRERITSYVNRKISRTQARRLAA